MHNYLRAIGISDCKSKSDVCKYIELILQQPDATHMVEDDDGIVFVQFYKRFAPNMGIMVCGEMAPDDTFHMEYYYPCFEGSCISTKEDVLVEKHFDREAYAGICEDVRLGVSLIFFIQNICDYKNELRLKRLPELGSTVTLSGLSTAGSILLPIKKSEAQRKRDLADSRKRCQLLTAAKQGDEAAMESLTIEDIDIYSRVSRRILQEDVFTLVDSFFMPYGVECERYSILGEIIELNEVKNQTTNDSIYHMIICCNEVEFDVCINKKDLLGEPLVGRRFKGIIWLQGQINFFEK